MFKFLSQASAFSPGSDLWVFPNFENSKWLRLADWYLAFQIARLTNKESQLFQPALNHIINECELQFSIIKSNDQAPLIIASEMYLPNNLTLIVPYQNNFADWIMQISLITSNLTSNNLRFFLPIGSNKDELLSIWSKSLNQSNITIVTDAN